MSVLDQWSRWDAEHGILERPIEVNDAFDTQFLP
jgi:hypothetical protein